MFGLFGGNKSDKSDSTLTVHKQGIRPLFESKNIARIVTLRWVYSVVKGALVSVTKFHPENFVEVIATKNFV